MRRCLCNGWWRHCYVTIRRNQVEIHIFSGKLVYIFRYNTFTFRHIFIMYQAPGMFYPAQAGFFRVRQVSGTAVVYTVLMRYHLVRGRQLSAGENRSLRP